MPQDTLKIRVSKTSLLYAACLVLGATGYTAAQAFADNDPATQNLTTDALLIPYEGYLKVDAAGVDGPKRLRFELFQLGSQGTPVWSEEQTVTMHNGRFSVGLGAVTPLKDTILDAQRLLLGITILEDDGAGGTIEVPLAGRQFIEPAPYAAWSAHAADFVSAGDLLVKGSAAASGGLTVGGDLEIASTEMRLGAGATRPMAQGASDTLLLNPGGDYAGGVVAQGARAEVTGALEATKNITLGGNGHEVVVEGTLNLFEGGATDGVIDLEGNAVTGLERVEGQGRFANGTLSSLLEFAPTAQAPPSIRFDNRTTNVISADLEVRGAFLDGVFGSPRNRSLFPGSSATDLGVAEDEGFCYIRNYSVRHASSNDLQTSACLVRPENGQWVGRIAGPGAGTTNPNDYVFCEVYCIEY